MHDQSTFELADIRALRSDQDRSDYLASHPDLLTKESIVALSGAAVELLSSDLEGCDDLLTTISWLADATGDAYCRGRALRAVGNSRYVQGRLEEAVRAFEEAAALFAEVGEELDEAITYSSGLLSILLTGDHARVEIWAERARSILVRHGDDLRLARLDFNYANVLFRRDRWEEAARSYESAHEIFLRLGSHRDVATCLSNMAVCQISVHNSDKAVYFYGRARNYCELHGLSVLTARIDYNYAYLYYLRGEYSTSLALFEQARDRCTALGDQYHPVLCNLDEAEIYLELNLTQETIVLASRAHGGFEHLGMPYESAKALTLWAIAVGRSGKWIAALEMLEKARLIFEREDNEVYKNQLDLHSGVVLLKAGRPFEAIRLAKRAKAGLASLGLHRKEAVASLLIGMGRLNQEEFEEAEAEIEKALALAPGPGSSAVLWQAHYLSGRLAIERDNVNKAETSFRLAHEKLEEIRSYVGAEEQKIPLLDDKLVVYEELVALLAAKGDSPKAQDDAFRFIEKAKARSLSDMVATRAANLPAHSSGRSQLASQVSKLREELNWYYRQIDLQEMRGDAQSPTSISPLLSASKRYEADLLASLGELSSTDQEFSSLQEALIVEAASIRGKLASDEMILDYYHAKGVLYVAVVSDLATTVVPLTVSSVVTELGSSLRHLLSKFESGRESYTSPTSQVLSDMSLLLKRLYDELIAPIGGLLKPKVVVVPNSSLFHIPFHALIGPDGPLIHSLELSYSPSATVWYLSRSRPAPDTRSVLVVDGDPGDQHDATLQIFSSPSVARTNQDFMTLAPHARVICASGTAKYRRDNPMFSTLRFAGREHTLFDLLSLRLDAELFALSGFELSTLSSTKGDEVFGLSRALLYAGSRAISHSLWPPGERASLAFNQAFLGRVARGQPPHNAFSEAIRELSTELTGPHEWASFVLTC